MREFPDLHGFYKENFSQTYRDEKIARHVHLLDDFYNYWSGAFVHAIEHDLRGDVNLDNNVMVSFLSTQTMVFDWIGFSLKCGLYDLVRRELCTILESLMLVSVIENDGRQLTLTDKLGRWGHLEDDKQIDAECLFQMTGLATWGKYYNLYRRLRRATSPSVGIAGRRVAHIALGCGQSLDCPYSRPEFLDCFNAWMDIAHAATQLVALMYADLRVKHLSFDPLLFKRLRPNTV